MKTTPQTNRVGIPYIGRQICYRPWKRGIYVGNIKKVAKTYDLSHVLLAAFQELNTHGPNARVKPDILAPSAPPVLSVNTRPGVGDTFELKGTRYLGSMTIPERDAFRLRLAWNNPMPPRTGTVCGQVML